MKPVFLTASLAVSLLIACTNQSSNAGSSNTSQTDSSIATSVKIYHAIEFGNTNEMDSLLALDVLDHSGPMGKEIKGKDSVIKMLADIHNHIKDLKMDVISSAGNGDYIFILTRMTGTVTDSTMGKPGEKIDSKSVDVVKVKDNKLTEHWGFADDNEVAMQMMAMQKK